MQHKQIKILIILSIALLGITSTLLYAGPPISGGKITKQVPKSPQLAPFAKDRLTILGDYFRDHPTIFLNTSSGRCMGGYHDIGQGPGCQAHFETYVPPPDFECGRELLNEMEDWWSCEAPEYGDVSCPSGGRIERYVTYYKCLYDTPPPVITCESGFRFQQGEGGNCSAPSYCCVNDTNPCPLGSQVFGSGGNEFCCVTR